MRPLPWTGWLLALPALLLFTACTTVGNGRMRELDQPQAAALLKPGETTRDDAERLLGRGEVLRFESSGWETWYYLDKQGLPKFVDYLPVVGMVSSNIESGRRELVLLFDAEGRLRKYSLLKVAPRLSSPLP